MGTGRQIFEIQGADRGAQTVVEVYGSDPAKVREIFYRYLDPAGAQGKLVRYGFADEHEIQQDRALAEARNDPDLVFQAKVGEAGTKPQVSISPAEERDIAEQKAQDLEDASIGGHVEEILKAARESAQQAGQKLFQVLGAIGSIPALRKLLSQLASVGLDWLLDLDPVKQAIEERRSELEQAFIIKLVLLGAAAYYIWKGR